MFLLHLPAIPPFVMLYELRLEKYSLTTLNYTLLLSGFRLHWAIVSVPILQLHNVHKLYHHCPYLSDFIYLPSSVFTESNKSCNLHTYVVWFYVVSKGNGFGLIKRAVWCCLSLTVDGSQPNTSPPGCSDVAEQNTHLIIYSFFFFALCLCQRKRSPLSTRVWRRRKNP